MITLSPDIVHRIEFAVAARHHALASEQPLAQLLTCLLALIQAAPKGGKVIR